VFDVCGQEVYGAYYFVARVFLDLAFSYNLVAYLQSKYNIPTDIIASEAELNINANNYGKTRWQNLYKISYKKDISFQEDNVHSMIGAFRTYIDAGNTIRGKKKLLGLFNVDN
jgi:hypothetical protein